MRVPTIRDIAKKAGVSVSTVSRVVGEYGYVSTTTRKKVLAACNQLNYKPNVIARSMVKKRTHTIGLIITDIHNPFYVDVIDVVEEIAHEQKYSILLCNSNESVDREQRNVTTLLERQVDGIIMVPVLQDFEEYQKEAALRGKRNRSTSYKHIVDLQQKSIPFIFIDRYVKDVDTVAVMLDNVNTAYKAMDQLLSKGYRDFLIVVSPIGSSMLERMAGINNACAAWGNQLSEENWVYCSFTPEDACTQAKSALLKRRPEVIFALDNAMTRGVMKAVNDLGLRINKDIYIIGFDDIKLYNSLITEKIGVISQPVYRMASLATQMLIDRIETRQYGAESEILRLEGNIQI